MGNNLSTALFQENTTTSISDKLKKQGDDNVLLEDIIFDIISSNLIEKYIDEKFCEKFQEKIERKLSDNPELVINKYNEVYQNRENTDYKKMCYEIGKYYNKIWLLFHMIKNTLNPQKVYKNKITGEIICDTEILESNINREDLKENYEQEIIYNINLCSKRLDELLNYKTNTKTKNCGIKRDDKYYLKYLDELYYDVYNPLTNKFDKRSDRMNEKYKKDFEYFSSFFNKSENKDASTFGELEIYKSVVLTDSKIDEDNELFSLFVKEIQTINDRMENFKKTMKYVLETVFVYHEVNENFVLRVNSKLTNEDIDDITEKTRNYIIDTYIFCQTNYETSMKIYQAIIEKTIITTLKSQIDELKNQKEDLETMYKNELDDRNTIKI